MNHKDFKEADYLRECAQNTACLRTECPNCILCPEHKRLEHQPQNQELIDWENKLRKILSKNKVKAFPRQAFYDVLLLLATQAKASQEKAIQYLKDYCGAVDPATVSPDYFDGFNDAIKALTHQDPTN